MTKHLQPQPRPSRFAEDYDESMEETLKPVRGKRSNNNSSNVFAEMRQQAEAMERSQSAQSLQGLPLSFSERPMSTPDFLNLTNMEGNAYVKVKQEFDNLSSGSLHIGPSRSQGSSPMSMHPNMASFSMMNAVSNTTEQPYNEFSSQDQFYNDASTHSSRYSSPNFGHNSHRRTESIASAVSAASIASINIEETKTDTGVTMEEIALYIAGPDPSNGKWTCTYESCGKTFGRKENIKSHVQTHLNDRQYQCPSCKKCFVRQHDLKRHAKIHTGIKPYPCECGNSFARHDALTRHRQRGMCIGAFDGIVRKVVKRGRPRKVRPDMEERLEKSERTRRRNKEANATAGSYSPSSNGSQSGYETSSAANSPSNDFDGVLDDAPFTDMDMLDVVVTSATPPALKLDATETKVTLSPGGISTATMDGDDDTSERQETACPVTSVSPRQITVTPSPAISTYSFHALPTLPKTSSSASSGNNAPSPAGSTKSNYTHGTPPELSASSSPPHIEAENARFFDEDDEFDPNASGFSDHSIGLGTTAAANAACGDLSLVDLNDESAWGINEDGLMQLHQDINSSVNGQKYFEDAEDAVALFTNGDDVFFGSS
jgi:regulatory protein SWI5